jgi:hypothetical protein
MVHRKRASWQRTTKKKDRQEQEREINGKESPPERHLEFITNRERRLGPTPATIDWERFRIFSSDW